MIDMKWYKSVRRITFLYVTIILVFGCEEHSTEPKEKHGIVYSFRTPVGLVEMEFLGFL